VRRATTPRRYPSIERMVANDRPIPDDAPMMMAFFKGLAWR
jgi:hypothetical protein